MKVFPYNDKLFHNLEHGSFTIVARELFHSFNKMDVLGDPYNPDTVVIQPECLDTRKKTNKFVPYLACEYSVPAAYSKHFLIQYEPFILTISDFARENILRGTNYDPKKIKTVHLGSNSLKWYKVDDINKFEEFTFLSVNSCTERSGFEYLIPAFHKFSQNKPVKLIIKDHHINPGIKNYISKLNNPRINYIADKLSDEGLRALYNKSHIFIYATNTTSFGMNIMDAALCGTPVIATMGSAIKEFLPDWTQPCKITSRKHNFEDHIFQKMLDIGIYSQTIPNKSTYAPDVYGEVVEEESIINSLEYSFNNYKKMCEINFLHRKFILDNYTWDKTAKSIYDILKTVF